jgi:hypothetical protein
VALDEAERLDAVYEAGDRNGSELVLGQARLPFEPPTIIAWAQLIRCWRALWSPWLRMRRANSGSKVRKSCSTAEPMVFPRVSAEASINWIHRDRPCEAKEKQRHQDRLTA